MFDFVDARERREKIKLRTSNLKHRQTFAAESAANVW